MATSKDRERSRSHGSRERESVKRKRSASGSDDVPSPAIGAPGDEPDAAAVLGPGGARVFGRPLRALLAEQRAAANKSPAKSASSRPTVSPRVLADVGNLLLLEPSGTRAADALNPSSNAPTPEKLALDVAAIYNEDIVPAIVLQLFDFIRRKGLYFTVLYIRVHSSHSCGLFAHWSNKFIATSTRTIFKDSLFFN